MANNFILQHCEFFWQRRKNPPVEWNLFVVVRKALKCFWFQILRCLFSLSSNTKWKKILQNVPATFWRTCLKPAPSFWSLWPEHCTGLVGMRGKMCWSEQGCSVCLRGGERVREITQGYVPVPKSDDINVKAKLCWITCTLIFSYYKKEKDGPTCQ